MIRMFGVEQIIRGAVLVATAGRWDKGGRQRLQRDITSGHGRSRHDCNECPGMSYWDGWMEPGAVSAVSAVSCLRIRQDFSCNKKGRGHDGDLAQSNASYRLKCANISLVTGQIERGWK
jgi:hypothetical protein